MSDIEKAIEYLKRRQERENSRGEYKWSTRRDIIILEALASYE